MISVLSVTVMYKVLHTKLPLLLFSRRFARLVDSRDKMLRAVVRCVSGEDRLSLSFTYSNADLKIRERQFNFNRSQSEQLGIAVTRIMANIEKETDKKRKRKKTSNEGSSQSDALLPLNVTLWTQDDVSIVASDTPCCEAFVHGSKLHIGDTVYEVEVNPPTVKSLSLPTNLMVGFSVNPKVDVEFTSILECSYTWYRSTEQVTVEDNDCNKSEPLRKRSPSRMDASWEHVGNSYEYVPTTDDLQRLLRVVCLPKSSVALGFEVDYVSKVPVSAGPGVCPFELRHAFTSTTLGPEAFRFVSYNILADLYADSDFSRETLFPYCPPYALDINYRKQLLLKELSGYNSDVICLQEVDQKVFDKDLVPFLKIRGFDGMINLKGGQVAEGLACFYRSSKFRLQMNQSIILAEEAVSNPLFANFLEVIEQNEKLKETMLQRTTALQVVILESVADPSHVLCIGNTHLYFRPDRDNIRLLQFAMCVAYLEQIAAIEAARRQSGGRVSTIFCGDFNSTPPFGVYQYAITQFIPDDHADWSSNADEVVRGLSLSHSLKLTSACGMPAYTNFTVGFADCIDYIFIEADKLAVKQVVPFPSNEELKQHTAIPSVTMPSDHIALVADIEWCDTNT